MYHKFFFTIFAIVKKSKKMLLFFTFWINFCCTFFAHPSYVSVTNMDIDRQRGNIELSIRMFTDDLETILHNKYNVDGWIGTPAEHRDGRRLLREYVNERFSLLVNNGEKIDLITDSMTINDDSMWFYMRGATNQTIRRIEIDNRLLTDFFSSQTNMVIVGIIGNEVKYYKLDRKKFKIELSL